MVYEDAINLISNVGFPIGAFIMMYYFAHKTLKDNTQALKELKQIIELKLKK